jgi:hypothetical protein
MGNNYVGYLSAKGARLNKSADAEDMLQETHSIGHTAVSLKSPERHAIVQIHPAKKLAVSLRRRAQTASVLLVLSLRYTSAPGPCWYA